MPKQASEVVQQFAETEEQQVQFDPTKLQSLKTFRKSVKITNGTIKIVKGTMLTENNVDEEIKEDQTLPEEIANLFGEQTSSQILGQDEFFALITHFPDDVYPFQLDERLML